jgi:hypothetical protein
MRGPVGILLAVIATVQAVVGVLFAFNVPAATALFPFDGRTPLSNIFIGSIFLAAAASTAWCLAEGSERAVAGIALDYSGIFVPFAIVAFASALSAAPDRASAVTAFAASCVVAIVFGLWLLRWALRHPWRDPRPLPRAVAIAFVVFTAALVPVGLALVLQVPGILPWAITPELSTLFGCMFLGAALYFAYGLVDRRWENGGGQLAGFLAYDIVLVVPFLVRLPQIDPGLLPNLVVYTAVVIVSGVLATWYLVLHAPTRARLRSRGGVGEPAETGGPETG